MSRKTKKIKQQPKVIPFKNNEELALWYCDLANIEHFRDLENHEIYWKHYQEDLKQLYRNKAAKTNIIPKVEETGIIVCEKCGTQIGAIIDGFALLNLKFSFKNHLEPLKIICKCGEYITLNPIKKEVE